ncbi:MAG TPA: hypothetical protein PLL61_06895 [Thiobacillus sp.]|nr:hypothetical protein [Thiobacillus sp.]
MARAIEILLALHEALRLLDAYRVPDSPWVPVSLRIVPPTSQNLG